MNRPGLIGRLLLAVGASVALHGLLGGIARRLAVDEAPRAAPIETVAVEVLVPPPSRAPLALGGGSVLAARAPPRRIHISSASMTRRRDTPEPPAPLLTESSEVSVHAMAAEVIPVAGPQPTREEGEASGGGEGATAPGGAGSGTVPDLGAFVDRLRQSALRCAPRRLGPAAEVLQARVRFCVDPSGRPQAVTLLQSTGDARLDRAALDCVIPGAAPLPATDRCLVVPLRFNL